MTCHKAELLLADYIDGQIQPGSKDLLKQHLKNCAPCRIALEEYKCLFSDIKNDQTQMPGLALSEKFDRMLQHEIDEKNNEPNPNIPIGTHALLKNKTQFYKVAAGILLVVAGFLAGMLVTNYHYEDKLSAGRQPDAGGKGETMTIALLNDALASNRIKAVNYIDEIQMPDNQVLTALITTMNQDKNINVRLAALYALTKYSDNEMVNDALMTSLGKQTEPLMQIALINVLTEKQELKAKVPIRNILQNDNTDPSVKAIAAKGLKVLKI